MMILWLKRLRNALNPRRVDDELTEELRDHIHRRAADLKSKSTISDAEAQRQAELLFGNVTSLQEQSREFRLWGTVEGTLQDLRYAWRGLRRSPAFALTAIVSLGLAIGAGTAVYSILDAALWRPLPIPQPERLFALASSGEKGSLFSYQLFEQLRSATAGDAEIALFDTPNRVVAQPYGSDGPFEQIIQQTVSPDAFTMLSIPPATGQLFSSREDFYPSPRAAVVLSHDYWTRRFGADPSVLGRRLLIDGRPFSILGVARKGFSGVEPGKFVDVWLPVTVGDPGVLTNPDIRLFHILGRFTRTTSSGSLESRLQAVVRSYLQVQPAASGVSAFRQAFSRPLWILFGISACILLIACSNVASLLLARSTARVAELALRVSLGARRSRLVRQLLTESLLISLTATILGSVLAITIGPALIAMVSTQANPVHLDLRTDFRVLSFSAAVCALCALFFGLLPAWQATRTGPIFALRHAGGHAGRLRMGRLFVTVQIAFAACLVTAGAGFLFSLRNLMAIDPGFDPQGVTVLTLTNSPQRNRQLPLLHEIQRRTAALPNVQAAATSWMPLLSDARRAQRILIAGHQPSAGEETFYRVSPGYLDTLHTRLIEGRDFDQRDNDNEPVASIVNRAFAKRYFGTEAVLGREFRRDDGVRHQIVGLAENSHFVSLRNGAEPIVYMPMKPPRTFTMYVRSTLDPASVSKMVEREAQSLNAGLRVTDVTALNPIVGATILREKLLAAVGGAFALLGLILAAIGLFGLLNYSVTRRTNEIGIRVALGARKAPIYMLVLKDLSGMIGFGLILGVAASLVLLRMTHSLLFGLQPADPLVIGSAIGVLGVAALIAGALPAHRAAAIDPMTALRHD